MSLSSAADGKAVLRMSDNGVGFGASRARGAGTGMALIDGLARQLGGRANWSSDGGVRLELEFRLG